MGSKIEDIVMQKKRITEEEQVLVNRILHCTERLKLAETYSKEYYSISASRSQARHQLKNLYNIGERQLSREIRDDIEVLKYHIHITSVEISKTKVKLSNAITSGRQTRGHQIHLQNIEEIQAKQRAKLARKEHSA